MSEPKPPSIFLQFALELAGTAAQEITPRFQNTDTSIKSDGTPVTEADTEAERVMRELIIARFPDHGIIGEEDRTVESSSEFTWIIDPIDGTAAFSLGLPTFGTLVALLKNGAPILGVINMPALKETLYAELGYGCWFLNRMGDLNRARVQSDITEVADAFVSCTGVYSSDIDPARSDDPFNLSSLIRKADRFRFVGDCIQHVLVARGLLDAAFDTEMHPWDNAAIIPCILEAGGMVSDGRGNTGDLVNAPSLLTSSSGDLHTDILSIINRD